MKQAYRNAGRVNPAARKQINEKRPVDDVGDQKYFGPKSHYEDVSASHATICHKAKTAAKVAAVNDCKNGRDDWIRTSDLTHPKRARYQAAPRPVVPDLVS